MGIYAPIMISGDTPPEPTPLDPFEVYANTRPSDWLKMPKPMMNELYLLFHIPDGASGLIAFTTECTYQYTVSLGKVVNGNFVSVLSTTLNNNVKYEAELLADDWGDLTSSDYKQVMIQIKSDRIIRWSVSPHSKRTTNFFPNIVEMSGYTPNALSISAKNIRSLVYFALYGVARLASSEEMFSGCFNLLAVLNLYLFTSRYLNRMFYQCYSLIAIPSFWLAPDLISMEYMFRGCSSLQTVPLFDAPLHEYTTGMFYGCSSLKTIPLLDTSNVVGMREMFYGCTALETIPLLDTSNVSSMERTFMSCSSLKTIPLLDTSNVVGMAGAFIDCTSLQTVPKIDISKVKDPSGMFMGCISLKAAEPLSVRSATTIGNMFSGCSSLLTIEILDSDNVVSMEGAFSDCGSLQNVIGLNIYSVEYGYISFLNCYALTSVSFVTGSCHGGAHVGLNTACLGHAALVKLFNSLPTCITSTTIYISRNPGVSELTASDIEIATNKNWVVNTVN